MLGRFVRAAVAFLKEESGPTAVEYAVMLALILLAVIAAVATLGSEANAKFSSARSGW
jgi:pilus assembly protein Flp/PilA